MALKDELDILFTGYRDFNHENHALQISQRVHGVTSPVMVNDGDGEEKKESDYEIKVAINTKGKTITAGEEVTYTATVAAKSGKTVTEQELKILKGRLNWMFWVGESQMSAGSKYHNLSVKSQEEEVTTNFVKDHLVSDADYSKCYTYCKFESSDEAIPKFKEKLTIKWSKWLEHAQDKDKKIRVRVEAYIGSPLRRSSKGKEDNTAACSRFVKAKPEILDAYWMNAEGKKITQTGYDQEIYLYLKTLGLKNKEITVNIYDWDYHPIANVPRTFPLYHDKTGNDLVEWKNNQIKIDDKGEAIKQFKVGNKLRYENAAKDEKDNEHKKQIDELGSEFFVFMFDYTEKYKDLELYVHIPEQKDLEIDPQNNFGQLILTEEQLISNAFFAEPEKKKG